MVVFQQRQFRLFKNSQVVAPAGATAEAWQRHVAQGSDKDDGKMAVFQQRQLRLFKNSQVVAPAGATAEAWQRHVAQGSDEDDGKMAVFQQPVNGQRTALGLDRQ